MEKWRSSRFHRGGGKFAFYATRKISPCSPVSLNSIPLISLIPYFRDMENQGDETGGGGGGVPRHGDLKRVE